MSIEWMSERQYKGIGGGGTVRDSEAEQSNGDHLPVFHVDELPQLVQAIGYVKYQAQGPTFLRGQSSLYGGKMAPSLYRSQRRTHSSGATMQLGKFIESLYPWQCEHTNHTAANCVEKIPRTQPRVNSNAGALVSGMRRYAVEPLLQHYGIRTGWIDVVDNIWVALWFACHDFVSKKRYVHIVKRTPLHPEEHVFVITTTVKHDAVVQEPNLNAGKSIAPGLQSYSTGSRSIDLRRAVPSVYLRPHSQHGLLVKPNPQETSLTLGAFQIPLYKALDWLGQSLLLSPFGLFPPATIDEGYRKIIDGLQNVEIPAPLGTIEILGPGY